VGYIKVGGQKKTLPAPYIKVNFGLFLTVAVAQKDLPTRYKSPNFSRLKYNQKLGILHIG